MLELFHVRAYEPTNQILLRRNEWRGMQSRRRAADFIPKFVARDPNCRESTFKCWKPILKIYFTFYQFDPQLHSLGS